MSTLRNSVQLIGHLGAAPEVKQLESGSKVARISIATTESYKDRNGEWKNESTWHQVVAWEALAERAEKYLEKGSFVLIQGRLVNRSYNDAKGEKKYVTEVRASNFMILDKKEKTDQIAEPQTEDQDLPF